MISAGIESEGPM
ncbi:hypothetical protein TIFTF001_055173 [Ficus carica]|uniref:Uncharacterized protein n=1 Tax=Ficus carica TaxID=3494 RepID=A0AA88JEU7_FICCA|nr:hypothetical protein TIFTF001_055173 [Ficus carica]